MTRSLTSFSPSNLRWTVLQEWLLPGGTERLWAGPIGQTLTFSSETYTGSADLISFDKVTETADGADARTVAKIRLLSGQSISDDLEDDETGTQVNIIFAALDSAGEIVEWLETVHYIDEIRYKVDTSTDESGAEVETPYIEVELVSPAVILDRAYTVNMTYTEQLAVDSSDHALEFVGDPDLEKVSVGGVNNPVLTNPWTAFYDAYGGMGVPWGS